MQETKANVDFVPGLVSIIVPLYNAEEFIAICVNSALKQTYKHIEILLINDGSSDQSGTMCESFMALDSRVRYFEIENHGPAFARNTGINASNGEFILFLDADDYLESNAIDLLIDSYQNTHPDMVIGNFKKLKNGIIEPRQDIALSQSQLLKERDILEQAQLYLSRPNKYLLFAYSWGRLFKSSIIKENNIKYDPALHTFEDVAFNFDYLRHATSIYFLNACIYNHLVYDHFASATMTIGGDPNKLFGFRVALDNIAKFLSLTLKPNQIVKKIGHAYITLTIIQLVRMCGQYSSQNKRVIHLFIREMVNDPSFRHFLPHYSPTQNDSKILPLLLKFKLVTLAVLVARYKARKRYGVKGK